MGSLRVGDPTDCFFPVVVRALESLPRTPAVDHEPEFLFDDPDVDADEVDPVSGRVIVLA